MTRPIGFWVKTVDRLIDASFAAAADELGITRRQWQILNVLANRGEANEADVAAALAPFLAAGEALDGHLAGLRGLVEAPPLRLTPVGWERLAQARERSVRTLRERLADGLTQQEYDTTVRTLERIARNLGWSEAATS